MDNARKLKFSSYVHLPSIKNTFQYRYAWVIQCGVIEVITVISVEMAMYVHLTCININRKDVHA